MSTIKSGGAQASPNPSVIIRLQNLAWEARSHDIRQFFSGLIIPDGGVHIIGGPEGDAFIAFQSDEDARKAMLKNGELLCGNQIRLLLSSKNEMYGIITQAKLASPYYQMAAANLANLNNTSIPGSPSSGSGTNNPMQTLHISSTASVNATATVITSMAETITNPGQHQAHMLPTMQSGSQQLGEALLPGQQGNIDPIGGGTQQWQHRTASSEQMKSSLTQINADQELLHVGGQRPSVKVEKIDAGGVTSADNDKTTQHSNTHQNNTNNNVRYKSSDEFGNLSANASDVSRQISDGISPQHQLTVVEVQQRLSDILNCANRTRTISNNEGGNSVGMNAIQAVQHLTNCPTSEPNSATPSPALPNNNNQVLNFAKQLFSLLEMNTPSGSTNSASGIPTQNDKSINAELKHQNQQIGMVDSGYLNSPQHLFQSQHPTQPAVSFPAMHPSLPGSINPANLYNQTQTPFAMTSPGIIPQGGVNPTFISPLPHQQQFQTIQQIPAGQQHHHPASIDSQQPRINNFPSEHVNLNHSTPTIHTPNTTHPFFHPPNSQMSAFASPLIPTNVCDPDNNLHPHHHHQRSFMSTTPINNSQPSLAIGTDNFPISPSSGTINMISNTLALTQPPPQKGFSQVQSLSNPDMMTLHPPSHFSPGNHVSRNIFPQNLLPTSSTPINQFPSYPQSSNFANQHNISTFNPSTQSSLFHNTSSNVNMQQPALPPNPFDSFPGSVLSNRLTPQSVASTTSTSSQNQHYNTPGNPFSSGQIGDCSQMADFSSQNALLTSNPNHLKYPSFNQLSVCTSSSPQTSSILSSSQFHHQGEHSTSTNLQTNFAQTHPSDYAAGYRGSSNPHLVSSNYQNQNTTYDSQMPMNVMRSTQSSVKVESIVEPFLKIKGINEHPYRTIHQLLYPTLRLRLRDLKVINDSKGMPTGCAIVSFNCVDDARTGFRLISNRCSGNDRFTSAQKSIVDLQTLFGIKAEPCCEYEFVCAVDSYLPASIRKQNSEGFYAVRIIGFSSRWDKRDIRRYFEGVSFHSRDKIMLLQTDHRQPSHNIAIALLASELDLERSLFYDGEETGHGKLSVVSITKEHVDLETSSARYRNQRVDDRRNDSGGYSRSSRSGSLHGTNPVVGVSGQFDQYRSGSRRGLCDARDNQSVGDKHPSPTHSKRFRQSSSIDKNAPVSMDKFGQQPHPKAESAMIDSKNLNDQGNIRDLGGHKNVLSKFKDNNNCRQGLSKSRYVLSSKSAHSQVGASNQSNEQLGGDGKESRQLRMDVPNRISLDNNQLSLVKEQSGYEPRGSTSHDRSEQRSKRWDDGGAKPMFHRHSPNRDGKSQRPFDTHFDSRFKEGSQQKVVVPKRPLLPDPVGSQEQTSGLGSQRPSIIPNSSSTDRQSLGPGSAAGSPRFMPSHPMPHQHPRAPGGPSIRRLPGPSHHHIKRILPPIPRELEHLSGQIILMEHVPFRATKEDILTWLSRFRPIETTLKIRHDDSGRPTGHAIVALNSQRDAEAALQMLINSPLLGRNVQVIMM